MASKQAKIGIIGGSGAEALFASEELEHKVVKTAYGAVSVSIGEAAGKDIVFLCRHGKDYSLPTQINYRANIAAMREEGVAGILATAAVGGINPWMRPGEIALLEDFIDFTHGKRETFSARSFVDLSRPYSPLLARKLAQAARKLGLKIHTSAVYVCTEGPRFETRAEIRMFRKLGADVVGMTQVPEVVLAAEAGIPYAAIGIITNYAAGVSSKKVSSAEVIAMMKEKSALLSKLILRTIKSLPD